MKADCTFLGEKASHLDLCFDLGRIILLTCRLIKAFAYIQVPKIPLLMWQIQAYRNNPKYWDRKAFANSVDPDQRCRRMRHLIRVYTVCHTCSNILDTSTGSKIAYLTISNFWTKKYLGQKSMVSG